MMKRFSVIFFLALFLLTSITLFAKTDEVQSGPGHFTKYKDTSAKLNLLSNEERPAGANTGKVFLGSSISSAMAPTHQVYGDETTKWDRQRYTSPGRYIVYAGYYNANCDYVFMDFSFYNQIGSTVLQFINFAIYDWGLGMWDLTGTGHSVTISPPGTSMGPNIDATTDEGWAMAAYRTRADENSPYYSGINYSGGCPTYTFSTDTVPGPPNVGNVITGYCDDQDPLGSPYIWPILDTDTTDDGKVITHVATFEAPYCDEAPTEWIEATALLYHRKIASVNDEPWGGTWEGPFFIDSAYIISQIVRANKAPGNDTVFSAYLRPMYYASGPTGVGEHPCTNVFNSIFWQWTNEVVYKVSDDNGSSWGPTISITDVVAGFEDAITEPANQDISGLVDPNGVFHIVWNANNWDVESDCSPQNGVKLWHWDNDNNCISLAYDGSHPAYAGGGAPGAWNEMVAKCNISFCDDKLYISFTRFGAHPIGDTVNDIGDNDYMNGDIMVVCSDATGGMGQTWTDGINLTDTESPDCSAPDCFSEHWPSMAMYSNDSLMIMYIEDKQPGAWGGPNDEPVEMTNNPVMFMTWPCFTMAEAGTNICVSASPTNPIYPEIPLAPNGDPTGCTTEGTYTTEVSLTNCGNVNLSYTTGSDASWLTVSSGSSGDILAGTGPRGTDLPGWDGKPGCATPAVIEWTANSTTLGVGNYSGTIAVDIDDAGADDIDIVVNVVVACDYYVPEYASITSGCWTVDVWSTPHAGNGSERAGSPGNMRFYACGGDTTLAPLYDEAFIVGWNDGEVKCYTDNSAESYPFRMRALAPIEQGEVGNPGGGEGYYWTKGYWCTPDSVVYGLSEFIVPGHQDTAVLIEKVTLWNEGETDLTGFLLGEGIDWDVDKDSNFDEGGIDEARNMVYQRATSPDNDSTVAGMSAYSGYDGSMVAAVLDNEHYIYEDTGYNVDTIYNYLTTLEDYFVFTDSLTDVNSVYRFYEGTLGVNDTLVVIKIKSATLDGILSLQELIDKGTAFVDSYYGFAPSSLVVSDTSLAFNGSPEKKENPPSQFVDITNANGAPLDWNATKNEAWLVLGATSGSAPSSLEVSCEITGLLEGSYNDVITITTADAPNSPQFIEIELILSSCTGICGDANGDLAVNVSDAVWVINYVFVGGDPPLPTLACGDANTDAAVNVSDAVWIINYVFVGGDPPADCSAGNVAWGGQDCCEFLP
jgi:Dockerin type I domain/Viral BACON domain